jgi:hypothetical protein
VLISNQPYGGAEALDGLLALNHAYINAITGQPSEDVRITFNDPCLALVHGYAKDTLKKAENATVWIVKPLILRDSESAAPNFSVFP